MIEAPDKALWAISNYGLYRFSNDGLQKYEFDLAGDIPPISGVTQVVANRFWLSTQGRGIWQFEFKDGHWPVMTNIYGKKEGLLSDVALNVHRDKESRVWVFFQNGISTLLYQDSSYSVKNYTNEDGIATTPTAKIKVLETTSGQLWMIRKTSISYLNLYQTRSNQSKPSTYIRSISLLSNNDPYEYATSIGEGGFPNQLRLPHHENFIQFNYTTTSFNRIGKNTFQFRLDGLEDTWSDRSPNTSVQYRGLKPGTYRFQVRAYNDDDVKGETADPITFTILHPFMLAGGQESFMCY